MLMPPSASPVPDRLALQGSRKPVTGVDRTPLPPAGPVWFGSVMGTGILATLLGREASHTPALLAPATALLAVGILLLLGLSAGFGARVVRDRAAFTATLRDLAILPTWGTVAMGMLSIGSAALTVLPQLGARTSTSGPARWVVDLAALSWVAGTGLGVVTAFGFSAVVLGRRLGSPCPAWGLRGRPADGVGNHRRRPRPAAPHHDRPADHARRRGRLLLPLPVPGRTRVRDLLPPPLARRGAADPGFGVGVDPPGNRRAVDGCRPGDRRPEHAAAHPDDGSGRTRSGGHLRLRHARAQPARHGVCRVQDGAGVPRRGCRSPRDGGPSPSPWARWRSGPRMLGDASGHTLIGGVGLAALAALCATWLLCATASLRAVAGVRRSRAGAPHAGWPGGRAGRPGPTTAS